jgi:uncharacterized protein (DUF342 family)
MEVNFYYNDLQTECRVRIQCDESETITLKDIQKALTEEYITHNIDKSALKNIVEYQVKNKEIIIATGVEPTQTIPPKIEYYFEHEKHGLKEDRVDYHTFTPFIFVKKGMRLAKKTPMILGNDGIDVHGENLKPEPVEDIPMPLGENVEISKDDEYLVIASTSGIVEKTKDGKVNVKNVFAVKNVDYGTGNIDFDGDVSVNGDVKSGFSVKSTGDIEIKGVVEDSIIEASGSVFVKFGLVGHHHGLIYAKENIELNHCENQQLIARGNITVKREIIDSKVISGDSIIIEKGRIIGGSVQAKSLIHCEQLGNQEGILTKIEVGSSAIVNMETQHIYSEIDKKKENLRIFEQELRKFELLKQRNHKFTEEMLLKYRKFREAKIFLEKSLEHLSAEIELFRQDEANLEEVKVIVTGALYSNVYFTFGNFHYKTMQDLSNVVVKLGRSGIELTSPN